MGRSAAPAPHPISHGALDINFCTLEQLSELITPAKAKSIITRREQIGLYTGWDQVEEASGIGPKTIAKLQAAGVSLQVLASLLQGVVSSWKPLEAYWKPVPITSCCQLYWCQR